MLIDNILSLIEEYNAYKQLPRMERAKRVILAPTIANQEQRNRMKKATVQDGISLAARAADIASPGLGVAASLGSAAVNIARTPTRRNTASEIVDTAADEASPFPIKIATTVAENKMRNARTQHMLDNLKANKGSSAAIQRMQKICAENPGLKGC